jgi:molybdopterin molybdotransferase
VSEKFFRVVSRARFEELLRGFPGLPERETVLAEAHGLVLARPVVSGEDLPAGDRSCMDGYAVRAADLFGASEGNPAYLEQAAELAVDTVADFELASGTCARIPTGGFLPRGADAVVMVEHTHPMGGGTIEMRRALAPGENVMLRGEDARAGAEALPAGRLLRAPEIGLLAALGVTRVWTKARPRVGVLSTGDEVVPVEAVPRPGQVRDVNSLTLCGLAREAGFEARSLGLVRDDLAALTDALAQALDQWDVVLVSGGSSVGARDLTVAAIESLPGAEILAHGVDLSPGKPTLLARVGERPILGLPGQVASAQVVMLVLGLPLLRHLAGDGRAFDPARRPLRRAVLARNVASKPGREDYVRVRLDDREDDLPLAHPVLGRSGLLRTLVEAQGLVAIPAPAEGLLGGTEVGVWMV